MRQLEHALGLLAERAESLPVEVLVERLEAQLNAEGSETTTATSDDGVATGPPRRRPKPGQIPWRGPLVAVGTAVAILVVVTGSLLLLGGGQPNVVEEPTTAVTVETPTTVPEVTTTAAPPPIPSEALIIPVVPSQAPLADQGPLEWRWDPNPSDPPDAASPLWPVSGRYCYGSGGDRSTVVEFAGGSAKFHDLGLGRTPRVVVTDAEGTVTDIGNPFGEEAYLCSIAATDTRILAVGSGVFWTDDAVTWNRVQTFGAYAIADAHFEYQGSGLMWAAAGPGGYIVAGLTPSIRGEPASRRVAWFSEDLDAWYEIPVGDDVWVYLPVELRSDDDPSYYEYVGAWWGWVPPAIAVGDEAVIHLHSGAWIGTRP